MGAVSRTLAAEEGLCILDLGATSSANIHCFTERGHKSYSEDVLQSSLDPSLVVRDEHQDPVLEDGKAVLDSQRFLAENLVYQTGLFDIVFCWNLPDYLDESLVRPVIGRLWTVMKPGGMLLAFFHTHDAGPDAPCYRYHILDTDTLEMQLITAHPQTRRGSHSKSPESSSQKVNFRLRRVFNNRHIENLFRDFASIKFFLARDNVREVLVVR